MEGIYQDAIEPALRVYLTGLREKAYIDVAPGFVDTGASPKETKPVYASTAPPAVKKKKTQKARLDQSHPAAAAATTAAATAAPAAAAGTAAAAAPDAKTMNVATNKKPRKIHREKIRFGQAPQNPLPAAAEQTLAPGADQGAGAASVVEPAPGTAISSMDQQASNVDDDPLAPKTVNHGKTRYSDRAPFETKARAAAKTAKLKQKAAATPAPLTPEEKAALQEQNAPLGLNGDTATKKKAKRAKGAPKERIQEKAPAPPAPKPEATPIPPKSVRDNGEPVVSPPPSNLPPVAAPPTDTQSTPSTAPSK
jgi:peptidyl-prolyl cis-trans isomerase SurA